MNDMRESEMEEKRLLTTKISSSEYILDYLSIETQISHF